MIRIKEFNTAYWGRIGTASTAYQFSDKVNAFIGASGSGKTTLMDALRVALGDAKFEYNRAMDHYINKDSNWSVVQVAFWNRENEGRPFLALGYIEPVVTVCVRLDRSKGDCRRDYYMFDGPIQDITNIGINPKAYQLNKVKHGEYLQRLETVGLTFAFRKLMLMKPEDVQNIVSLDSNRLFQLIFDIKGQKNIQVEHDQASEKLKEVKNLELQSDQDLSNAQKTLSEYENKKVQFEENENRKIHQKKLNVLLYKKKYWDNKNELERQRKLVLEEENRHKQLENNKEELTVGLELIEGNLEGEMKKEKEVKEKIGIAFQEVGEKKVEHAKAQDAYQSTCNEIKQIETIEFEEVDILKSKNIETNIVLQQANFDYTTSDKKRTSLRNDLNIINQGGNTFPGWVTQFRNALERQKVPHLILAENISIKPQYELWIAAIEAYLGRYRIVTSSSYHLQSKKIQELYEYGARVSQSRISKQAVNKKQIKGDFVSLRSALDIDNIDQIGGYLDYLNNIYLVESVEEGHILSQNGYKSLTQKGLLQDQEGGLFLKVKELVCGRFAKEKYKKQLEKEIEILQGQLDIMSNEKRSLETLTSELIVRIDNQNKLLKLPELTKEKEYQKNILNEVKSQLDHANKEYNNFNDERDKIIKTITELKENRVEKEAKKKAVQKNIEEVAGTINGYRGSIGNCKIALEISNKKLKEIGYDDHAISFIEIEILEDKILTREDGTEWNSELLEITVNELIIQIEDYEKNSDIDPGIIAMVEPQKNRVDYLIRTFDLAREDREKWEQRLALAEISLKNHVHETMSQYIEEFKSMAGLLSARAEGKFQQEGPSYLNWQIRIKIGFDGKELVYYDDPEFSSGQRAAISIMLLLAAVSNQKEDTHNSLMFLDEPTSRVDDARANEIGVVLQKSNVQYFITHQISESLKSIDWIDHAFITSKLRSGQKFADPPIFETRRQEIEVTIGNDSE